MTLATELAAALPDFLGRQRWFGGDSPREVDVVELDVLHDSYPKLLLTIVEAGDGKYVVPIGLRPSGEEFPSAIIESAIIGTIDDDGQSVVAYDALFDLPLAQTLLAIITDGRETADRVRPMGKEQSNSSLVFDERLVVKFFRRYHEGSNPDVEITTALASVGYEQVAKPAAVWQRNNHDLAIAQEFLAGGADGWHLALTSLRDLFAEPDDPWRAGGDFGAESARLGQMTASMHLALAKAMGVQPGDADTWAAGVEEQLAKLDRPDVGNGARLVSELRNLEDAGPAIRIHGDYHLGQVFRTDAGWFVIDFEGEPARPLDERRRPHSPLKDVTGMLRSFQYASLAGLVGREEDKQQELQSVAKAWEERNRKKFLDGYMNTPDIERLLPANGAYDVVLAALELEKAAYEAAYESAFRPTWAPIPNAALDRLLGRDPGAPKETNAP